VSSSGSNPHRIAGSASWPWQSTTPTISIESPRISRPSTCPRRVTARRCAPATAAAGSTYVSPSRRAVVPEPRLPENGPGRVERAGRSPALTGDRARPRRLGHVVLATPDLEASHAFFVRGLGFRESDAIGGLAWFLRCSTDHHNLLIQRAPATFLHHTAWEVADADEIGRGARQVLEVDPARHAWGFGRHHVGSNFFWYLRDPAGHFAEYYSDLDVIPDDAPWTPQTWEGRTGLYAWGPPPPRSFLVPDDLGELIASAG
jgi:catechol 2,3-dioxygenase-like lactoylglutathione lyase family enzyme